MFDSTPITGAILHQAAIASHPTGRVPAPAPDSGPGTSPSFWREAKARLRDLLHGFQACRPAACCR